MSSSTSLPHHICRTEGRLSSNKFNECKVCKREREFAHKLIPFFCIWNAYTETYSSLRFCMNAVDCEETHARRQPARRVHNTFVKCDFILINWKSRMSQCLLFHRPNARKNLLSATRGWYCETAAISHIRNWRRWDTYWQRHCDGSASSVHAYYTAQTSSCNSTATMEKSIAWTAQQRWSTAHEPANEQKTAYLDSLLFFEENHDDRLMFISLFFSSLSFIFAASINGDTEKKSIHSHLSFANRI